MEKTNWLVEAQSSFDWALAKRDWATAHAIIGDMGEAGFETESVLLLQALNRAKASTVLPMMEDDEEDGQEDERANEDNGY